MEIVARARLTWPVCADGYEAPKTEDSAEFYPEYYGRTLAPASDQFREIEVFDDRPFAFLKFLDAHRSAEGFVGFANKHGQLSEEPQQLLNYASLQEQMRALWESDLDEWSSDQSRLLDPSDWIDRYLIDRTNLRFVSNEGADAPALTIEPIDLEAALMIQLGTAMLKRSLGTYRTKKCEECGSYFETGSGTGRRSTAQFCSRICADRNYNRRRGTPSGEV